MSHFIYQSASGESTSVEFELRDGALHLDGESYPCDGEAVWLDGRRVPFAVTRVRDKISVWLDAEVYSFSSRDPRERTRAGAQARSDSGIVTAQMPGKVLSLAVRAGDQVSAGQNLLIMESMKMELALNAPIDGIVTSLEVAVGQMVSQGELLVTLTPEETV